MSNNQQVQDILSKIPSRTRTEEIVMRIEEAIRTSLFKPGEKLPSEPHLADLLGVSRNTLREAMKTLIDKGVLFRLRGVGTFVTAQSEVMLQTNLERVVGTSQIIRNQGCQPGQRFFISAIIQADTVVAQNLQLEPGSSVLHISRIRTADNTPVIWSEEFIPMEILGDLFLLDEVRDHENWSIYNYLTQLGYEIKAAITRVRAILADSKLASLLELNEGQPLLRLEQTHYSNNYLKPVLYCVNYHNDQAIDVVVVRKG